MGAPAPALAPSARARPLSRLLGKPLLVSSVMRGPEIGVVYADAREAWLAAHLRARLLRLEQLRADVLAHAVRRAA